MLQFANSEKDLIVVTSETRWDETPRMRHYLSQQLSKHFNVLYFELYSKGQFSSRRISDSLIVAKVGYYLPGVSRFKFLKEIYNRVQSSIIVSFAKKYKACTTILFNFQFDFWSVYKNDFFKIKYFFLNDDFVNMDPNASASAKLQKQTDLYKTASLSNRVFASSEPLAKDVEHLVNELSVIYSGHDFVPQYQTKETTSEDEKFRVCVMGFISINLEFEWLVKLAESIPNITVNLIGPIEKEDIKLRLSGYKNIVFHSPKTGTDLQNFLMEQDVLLMPYTVSLVNTKASVPAKLFQYLACGKPVVSSLMPDLIELPGGFVYQSSNANQFLHNVKIAQKENSDKLIMERMKFAEKHTWDKRGVELIDIIISDKSKISE